MKTMSFNMIERVVTPCKIQVPNDFNLDTDDISAYIDEHFEDISKGSEECDECEFDDFDDGSVLYG